MKFHVLGIGYAYDRYSLAAANWTEYDIEFDFADNWLHAVALLTLKDYVCVAVCTEDVPEDGVKALRAIKPIPIVVIPPTYDEAQRYACIHFGAALYLHSYGEKTDEQDSMRQYLKIPCEKRKPLTVITVKGLSVCLEKRTVEVMGTPVELTGIEFDILSLLITRQHRILTYGMIVDLIWEEPCDLYSKKAVISHVYNLRRKLRISPDVPNYIRNVPNIGYTFDINNTTPFEENNELNNLDKTLI